MEFEKTEIFCEDVTEIKKTKLSVYWDIIKKALLVFFIQIIIILPLYKKNEDMAYVISGVIILSWVFFKKRDWLKELIFVPYKKMGKKELNLSLLVLIIAPLVITLFYMFSNCSGIKK